MKKTEAILITEEIQEEISADGSFSGVEKEEEETQEPFDPEKISIDSKVVPIEGLIRRLKQNQIRLAPSFQRNDVWDQKRKSRLIESLMLKIPLPMFYVAADTKGDWDVVDGLQRITTMKQYIIEQKFNLEGLEFWGNNYNSSKYKDLPEFIQNRILEAEFQFTIINPGTPEEVKRNIFKRINTGGMPLTAQEIRHALYQGIATKLLEELVNSDSFRNATGGSIKDSRMAGRELILRFLAFTLRNYKNYSKSSDMDKFLSDTMRIINLMPIKKENDLISKFKDDKTISLSELNYKDIDNLKKRFKTGMERAYNIFGENTFRKSFENERKAPINKALFETWGNLLADIGLDSFNILLKNKHLLIKDYKSLFEEQNFKNLFSRDSLKYSSIQNRFMTLGNLIKDYT